MYGINVQAERNDSDLGSKGHIEGVVVKHRNAGANKRFEAAVMPTVSNHKINIGGFE